MSRRCFLRCITDSHMPIKLSHDVDVTIGRSKITKIKDQSCSRQQLILKADCDQCFVEIIQHGVNPSGLDGFALKRSVPYKAAHGSKIEVLLNNYFHVIEFDPPPENSETSKNKGKRKLIEEGTPSRKKKVKTEMEDIHLQDIEEATESKWEEIDQGELYVFTPKGLKASNKIAAFDMDGTLIKTKSGKVYPVDMNDWQIIFTNVAQKLKELLSQGYKLVILSNQAPIGSGRVKIEDFKLKVEGILDKLGLPIQVFLATGKTLYRKPATGMWKYLAEKKNDNVVINIADSLYCGDAACRIANWAPGKKKDHSMADKLLAENLGIQFYTPEQFFLGHSIKNVPMSEPEFNPKTLKPGVFNENLISNNQEILVLVGFPGSGKSFLAKQIQKKSNHQYVSVCRDILGSWQKCAAEASKSLERGKSVIVDSTNPDVESRSRWISLAKEKKVACRCAKMAASKAHSQHNNRFRELMKINHVPVSDIVFHTYKNKFTEPSTKEGFNEVIEVQFAPTFDDKSAEEIYKMYLLEK